MKLYAYEKDNETHYRLMFTDAEKDRYKLSYWGFDTINRPDIIGGVKESPFVGIWPHWVGSGTL